jgi:3-hydroxyisobutyrate dehydrogenase
MYVALAFVTIFFNAAVIGTAMKRLEGQPATIRDGLALARAHIGKIFVWALITASVGMVLRAIQERSGLLGRILIGFIGLGKMGRPMATNLCRKGSRLVVYDVSRGPVDELAQLGAEVASGVPDLASRADIVFTMLPDSPVVDEVVTGRDGVLANLRPGSVVVDMSTIDPLVARRIGDALAARGVVMLDAPVSGGTERANSGELSVIVGGPAETFEACRDLFKAMGTKIFHVGGLGQGLAMKLVNNMLVQVNMVAVAEALVLGVKAGLDPKTIYEVVRVSTGTSSAFERGAARMLARDFSPAGTVDISFKDQELETAFAKQLGAPLLLANVSQQVYQMARAAGLGKQDGTAIIQVLERLAGVKVGG